VSESFIAAAHVRQHVEQRLHRRMTRQGRRGEPGRVRRAAAAQEAHGRAVGCQRSVLFEHAHERVEVAREARLHAAALAQRRTIPRRGAAGVHARASEEPPRVRRAEAVHVHGPVRASIGRLRVGRAKRRGLAAIRLEQQVAGPCVAAFALCLGPRRPRGQRRPPDEHQPRAQRARQVLGERKADPFETAGDEVGATRLESGKPVDRPQRARLHHLPPPVPAANGQCLARRLEQRIEHEPHDACPIVGVGVPGVHVDRQAIELRILERNRPARAEHRGLLGPEHFAAGDLVQLARENREPARRQPWLIAERPRDREQAREAARVHVLERCGAAAYLIVRIDRPAVDDLQPRRPACGEHPGEPVVVRGIGRIDGAPVAPLLVPCTSPDGDHLRTGGAELTREVRADAVRVDQYEPQARVPQPDGASLVDTLRGSDRGGRHPLPRRDRQPLRDIGLTSLARGLRESIDPMTIAGEGVRGQGDPPRGRFAIESLPRHRDPRAPQRPHGAQHRLAGSARFVGMRRGRQSDHRPGRCVTARECRQRRARPHFDEQRAGHREDFCQAVGEPHRAAQMASVIRGIDGLLGGDPRAGDVRDIARLRRSQTRRRHPRDERPHRGVHHLGVKGVRGVEWTRVDSARHERNRERGDGASVAGHHAAARRIHRGQRYAGRQHAAELAGVERHRRHGAGRQRARQPAALDDDRERILERHHPGQAGGDVLPDAMADHRGRLHTPLQELARERVREAEDRRLREPRVAQPRVGRRVTARRLEQRTQIDAGRLREDDAAIELGTRDGERGRKAAAHARVLRAWPGNMNTTRGAPAGAAARPV
jgi:hypothetical protein